MTKLCTKCGKQRDGKFFKKDNRYAQGLFCWCHDCESSYAKSPEVKKRNKERYVIWIANPENKKKELMRSRIRAKNPEYKRAHKNREYKKLYGITLDRFEKQIKKQKGKCKLCGRKRRLCADHNHTTKKFRGAVCWPCNTLMGHIEQSPGLLNKMAKYLKEVL